MAGVNKAILLGNLGKDPEVKEINGTPLAKFSMATTEYYKNKNGEKVEDTQWHNLAAWGNLATRAEKLLRKGDRVAIDGRLRYHSYNDKDGNNRFFSEIIINEMMLISSKHDKQTV